MTTDSMCQAAGKLLFEENRVKHPRMMGVMADGPKHVLIFLVYPSLDTGKISYFIMLEPLNRQIHQRTKAVSIFLYTHEQPGGITCKRIRKR